MDTLSGTAGLGSVDTAGLVGVNKGTAGGKGARRLVFLVAAVLPVVDRSGLPDLGS